MRVLESERLLMKPVEEEDIFELLELRWDSVVTEQIVHDPISPAQQLQWFRSQTDRDLALCVFEKQGAERRLIGINGVYNINPRHQLGVWRVRFWPEIQGKGYAVESSRMMFDYAFNTLNLRRITSTSFADNPPAMRLLERMGSKREGLLRQHLYSNGKFRDVVTYGLLKEEFFEACRKLDEKKKK